MIPMIIEASSQLGNLRPPPPPLPLELALLVIFHQTSRSQYQSPVPVREPVLELETPPVVVVQEVLTPESELDAQEASNKLACVEHEFGEILSTKRCSYNQGTMLPEHCPHMEGGGVQQTELVQQ